MSGKARAAHRWGSPVPVGTEGRTLWKCQRCPLVVELPPKATAPSDTASGRLVNGKPVSYWAVLPSCRAYVPVKQEPDLGRLRKGRFSVGRDPFASRDHELSVCVEALGRSWVEATIGPRTVDEHGNPDLDWELSLLQLYSAVRVIDLDAVDLVPLVKRRMAERARREGSVTHSTRTKSFD